MLNQFLGRRDRYNIFSFECPHCRTIGECGVPHNKVYEIFQHGDDLARCPALFVQQPAVGLFAQPQLVCVNDVVAESAAQGAN